MATAQISPNTAGGPEPTGPRLQPGEHLVTTAEGVLLGWQWRTVLIWWLPGLVFIGLGQLEFHSLVVTAGLLVFCAAMFAFYSSDSEVRPRGSRKRYLLTDRRLLIAAVDPTLPPRALDLTEVATTRMEKGLMDRAVARLSGAATIVLEMRDPGPKGQPRRLRIGPMREPDAFRDAIELGLGRAPGPDPDG
ncbi:MAG TPA: hypothetical protein VGR61_07720 [Candidatus Dormibacteraeota bacterium]|nr:hypothetical protein [Candidatus Dormibacteraeota bacterium]